MPSESDVLERVPLLPHADPDCTGRWLWHSATAYPRYMEAPMARRILEALSAQQEREPLWNAFHRCWTACVGTERYDKAPWRECAMQVGAVVGPMGTGDPTPATDATPTEDRSSDAPSPE
jgi:hypothetical protein